MAETNLDRDLFRVSRLANQDLHMRKIVNAADALDGGDYVTLRQLREMLGKIDIGPRTIATTTIVTQPGPSSSTPFYNVPFSTTPIFYRANGSRQKLSLTGSCSFDISGFTNGDELILLVEQDGTGDWVADPIFGALFLVPPGFAVSLMPNSHSYFTFVHNGAEMALISSQLYYV